MSTNQASNISIVAKFNTPQHDVAVEHRFDKSNCEVARIGLPEGVEAVKVSKFAKLFPCFV